jgi:hypothetical protein
MTTFKLFGAALILAAVVAAPVAAQQAIQEPGNYAFYHPNGDVLNSGSSRPADAMASQLSRDVAGMRMSVKPHKMLSVRAPAKRY